MARKPQSQYEPAASKTASGRIVDNHASPVPAGPKTEELQDSRSAVAGLEVRVEGVEPMTVYRVKIVENGVVVGTSKRLLAGPEGVLTISVD